MHKIEPKFRVGDVVTNISGLYPNVTPTINEVDILNQCYRYKEIGGITWFKDQDKLTLVETDNCEPPVKDGDSKANIDSSRHPVEDDTNKARAIKINPNIIPVDVLRDNKFIYDEYTLFVQEMMCAIKVAASQGHNKLHFSIGEKDISVFQLGQDFTNAGYKVSAVIGNDKNSEIDIEW